MENKKNSCDSIGLCLNLWRGSAVGMINVGINANASLFLVSDTAKYFTGYTLPVDGAMSFVLEYNLKQNNNR